MITSPPCGNKQHQKHSCRKQGFLFRQEVPRIYMKKDSQVFFYKQKYFIDDSMAEAQDVPNQYKVGVNGLHYMIVFAVFIAVL